MVKVTKKIDLSEHTLDVNRRKYSINQLDLPELDDYIRALAGSRDYEYNAIRDIMIYLWGGSYDSIQDLAEENWNNKEVIRQRFRGNKDAFLGSLPLPKKLSGVCHMATGTGKSYVIFAVAYLSILLGKVDRVLVLTPSSTIIKKDLRDKFKEYLHGERGLTLEEKLPAKYRHKAVKLIKRNDPPQDDAIMVENINGVYQYFHDKGHNSIAGFFDGAEEVLVLSDEVHHAYSRWDPSQGGFEFDELNKGGRQTDAEEQRRWMKFIREAEHSKIKRHIGFTGTPYNQDDFFTDVLFNYSIKRGIDEKYIKDIDSLIKYDEEINRDQRYEQIIQSHLENQKKYSYKKSEKPQVKPITVFVCKTIKSAKKHTEEFALKLADYLKNNVAEYQGLSRSALEVEARKKVICVVSKSSDKVIERFENVEEIDPDKTGGKVEYIFSVQKLTEGWDVDNVFQIVPMEERAFNSKLLISQVLGRGLRIPREIRKIDVEQTYPMLTVTNHESFSQHIEELLNQVTQSEIRFTSQVFTSDNFDRHQHHFDLFNLRYVPDNKTVEKKEDELQTSLPRNLNLEPQEEDLKVKVTYSKGIRNFKLSKDFRTVDQIVSEINQKFKAEQFERKHFDFGDGVEFEGRPGWDEIKQTILNAMDKASIEGNKISKENQNKINLFFNQYLPQGKKKVVRQNIEGQIYGVTTEKIAQTSASAGGLDNYTSIFISEEYQQELTDNNLANLEELQKKAENNKSKEAEGQMGLLDKDYDFNENYIRMLLPKKNVFVVNQSMFRTPQDMIIVSHEPEREFVFKLIENSKLVDSWVKSPDKGFYSLDYTFWKGGKDSVTRSFNPDFFIKLDLNQYLLKTGNDSDSSKLRKLQDQGIKELILVVEIKGDVEMDKNVVPAKTEAGKEHFESVSKRLEKENPINFKPEFRNSAKQHYEFFLLRPEGYSEWFRKLEKGHIYI